MLKKGVLYFILLILASVLIYGASNFKPAVDTELENKINKLEHIADSLKSVNTRLDSLTYAYNKQLVEYKEQVQLKDQKINQLKTDVKKRVNAIDTASYYELVKFFSDRYDSSFSTSSDSTFNN